MKLRDMLEAEWTTLDLSTTQRTKVIEVVSQWLYDRATSLDRSDHHGHTIRDLIAELHEEEIDSPVPMREL